MTKKIPEVRIGYSFLLSDAASSGLNELRGDGTPLRSFEYYTEVADKYTNWWKDDGDKILRGLCKITGLDFYQNTIDVHVAPWFYAFSNPMVLGVKFKSKDDLVNTLTHEIIHRLLTDNTTYKYGYDFIKLWQSMLGKDIERVTLVHIPVHAIMEELYAEVIDRPDLIEFDKKSLEEIGAKAYVDAWKYVETHGYKSITDKIRAHAIKLQPAKS